MESKEPKKKKVTASSGVKKVEHKHEAPHGETKNGEHEHVVHHKKKLPAHITAMSIFISEFKNKRHSSLLAGVSLLSLILIVFVYVGKNSPDATRSLVGFKVKGYEYINNVYNFSFRLPKEYTQVREAPDQGSCLENTTWDNQQIKSVTVAEIQNISVVVGCQTLSDVAINQFVRENVTTKEITVNTRKAYSHIFVTSSGYLWRVVQVPLDNGHYVEISHNYKPLPTDIANEDLAGYKPLSEGEWLSVINSLSFN